MRGADAEIGDQAREAARQLAQAFGLRLKLLQRFLVKLPQGPRFTSDRLFERAESLVEIEFVGRSGLPLRLAPLMKRQAETIQLRLEARQTLFQTWIVLLHRE